MMKAAIIEHCGESLHIEQVPIPRPGPNDILIRLKVCGFCHTDLHAIDGDWKVKPKTPLCPGHEGAGIVEALGSEVKSFAVGDHVGVPWLYSTCGHCEYCISGWETLCKGQLNCGYSVDGCFREYTVAPASHAVPLPRNIDFHHAAPILCAGVTAYKALKESEARAGQFVCILGAAGGLGHMAIQYANAMGLRVIAIEASAEKIEYCKFIGAEFSLNAFESDITQQVREITCGGAHAVIVIAASLSAYSTALTVCRPKGFVVCVALPKGEVPMNIEDIVLNRITIRGSIVGTREDMREALDFASRGLVKCRITRESLDHINQVAEGVKANLVSGRVVLHISH